MFNNRNSVRQVIMLKAAFLMSIALLVSGFYGCSKTRDTSYTGDSNRVATASPNQDSGTMNNNKNDMVDIINDMHDNMSKVDMTGDYDYDYSQLMIEHHRADVKLLDEEIDNGKDQNLVSMAKSTKDLKNKEIDEMKDWASNYKDVMDKNNKNNKNNKKNYSDADYDRMRMNMMAPIDDMIKNMHSMNMTGNTDADFVAVAIHNGQAGIKMSNNEIKNGKNSKLKDMARTLIREDEKMGKDLQKWQDTRRTSKMGK